VTAAHEAPARDRTLRAYLLRHSANLPIVALFVLVVLGFGLTTERYFTVVNIANVLRQGAPLVIMAVGATFVLVAAGIDLSIGAVVGIVGVSTALVLRFEPGYAGLVFAFALAALVGSFNGFLIAYQRLPAFIVTLGTLSVLTGFAQLLTRGLSVAIETDDWLIAFGQGRVGIVPVPVLIALAVALVGWVVLNRTAWGLRVRGIGSNEESVRRAGVPVNFLVASVYVVSSLTAALGGIIVAMRLQSGNSTAGTGLEL
jgi:simple sugar transport system permease protein